MNERLRTPAPLLPRRIPSGRGATEQPNATSDLAARLTLRFWAVLLVAAVLTGLFGAALMAVLHATQHLAYGYRHGSFEDAVAHDSPGRRLLVLALGGAVLGPAWYLLRRAARGSSDVDDEVWTGTGRLSFRRAVGTGVLSEVAVGVGASLGREAAPKLLGGATGSLLARLTGLDDQQRRLLVACGAGAGLACVYNVPLGGALLTAELLYGQLTLTVVLPALVGSVVATVTAWAFLGTGATYPDVTGLVLDPWLLVVAVVLGPLLGLGAVLFTRLVGWVSHHQLRGRALLVGPLAAFALLGLLAGPMPLLLGNGKDLTHAAFTGTAGPALSTLVLLAVLKPLLTALCLGSGASGGLFTPVLSTGAVTGLLAGDLLARAWHGAPSPVAVSVIAAAALSGAAMQAPLTALTLVLELTRTTADLLGPMVVATALATVVARRLDGYSIYSARLPARTEGREPLDPLHA